MLANGQNVAGSTMWVKICGIRDVATASMIAEAGANAIGLNFFAASPRSVTQETAADIVQSLPATVEPVGLFVNHPLAEIKSICAVSGINLVQLHGDESPEFLAELPSLRKIRAFRLGTDGFAPLAHYLSRCAELGVDLEACLLDALVPGMYGGSGKTVAWDQVTAEYRFAEWPPLILAGGLHPQNVAEAIRAVHPWGIDVASGVESAPGVKDAAMVREFIDQARRAQG